MIATVGFSLQVRSRTSPIRGWAERRHRGGQRMREGVVDAHGIDKETPKNSGDRRHDDGSPFVSGDDVDPRRKSHEVNHVCVQGQIKVKRRRKTSWDWTRSFSKGGKMPPWHFVTILVVTKPVCCAAKRSFFFCLLLQTQSR